MTRVMRIAAWVLIAGIAFVTLSPPSMRPRTGHPNRERFAAYLLCAACFTLAYPHRRKAVLVILVASAGGLEIAKLLAPERHAQVSEFAVKACGALAGSVIASLPAISRLGRRPR